MGLATVISRAMVRTILRSATASSPLRAAGGAKAVPNLELDTAASGGASEYPRSNRGPTRGARVRSRFGVQIAARISMVPPATPHIQGRMFPFNDSTRVGILVLLAERTVGRNRLAANFESGRLRQPR